MMMNAQAYAEASRRRAVDLQIELVAIDVEETNNGG